VPGDNEKDPGLIAARKTWPKNIVGGGGATIWDAISYDPELELVYFGTGNAGPWSEDTRISKGFDLLFAASIVAVDVNTGLYRWHYQNVPGDEWDFDSVQHLLLADVTIKGVKRKVIMQANKNGFLYTIDRTNGKFIMGKPFAKINWALGRAKQDAELLAASDPLTGALSRRAILPLIEKTLKRVARTGVPACVAMIDLDWFKSINDRFGHLAGDQVLRRVVERVRDTLRNSDVIGRYGGEEFVLLLQGADAHAGARLVERIRAAVSATDWSDIGNGLKVSVSCGIAGVGATDTLDSILARADQALYEAKRGGRDQLRVA